MKPSKARQLDSAGWRVGSPAEFLDLTPDEAALVEMRVSLSEALRTWRTKKGLTQGVLAEQLGSSQSRVAKMEAADASVSLDLLMRALLQLGASRKDIAKALA
jgi:predicted XRE-type DNA-binding protein